MKDPRNWREAHFTMANTPRRHGSAKITPTRTAWRTARTALVVILLGLVAGAGPLLHAIGVLPWK